MDDGNQQNDISRRNVLKKAGAAGATTLALGSAANTASGQVSRSEVARSERRSPDFEIVSRSKLSDSEAQSEIEAATASSPVQNIDQAMRNESSVEDSGVYAVSFETDDPKINETNPTVLFRGYRSNSSSEVSVGMMVSINVDTTPDAQSSSREPMMAFGRTVEESQSRLGSLGGSRSSSELTMKTFTADERGRASMIGQEKIQKPIQANPSDGGVTTQGWRDEIGWGACTAVVTTLCEGGTGTVSRTACLSACAPFISTFWGYGACGAACFVIVDTVNSYGCGIGAAAICDEIM